MVSGCRPGIVAVDSLRSDGYGNPWGHGPPSAAMIKFKSESACFRDNQIQDLLTLLCQIIFGIKAELLDLQKLSFSVVEIEQITLLEIIGIA